MSGDEDFLARWSRRKREAEESANAQPLADSARAGKNSPDGAKDKNAPEDQKSAAPEAEFDLSTLPSIDSITSATDVTVFMRAGVPAELTRAALRRAWSTDPLIRDFIGLAENQWDFTKPNEMAGFGPIGSADEVQRLLAEVMGDAPERAIKSLASAEPEGQRSSVNTNDSKVLSSAPKDGEAARSESGDAEGSGAGHAPAESSDNRDSSVAVQKDTDEAGGEKQLVRRTHGSALPR